MGYGTKYSEDMVQDKKSHFFRPHHLNFRRQATPTLEKVLTKGVLPTSRGTMMMMVVIIVIIVIM